MLSAPLPVSTRVSTHALDRRIACLAAIAALLLGRTASAQDASAPPRTFAPGVMTTVPVDVSPGETVNVHPIVELRAQQDLDWRPEYLADSQTLYSKAEVARFTHDAWCLEFSFKPMRMIWVDVPQANGKLERKLVWYLVYSVKNTGQGLAPPAGERGEQPSEATDIGPVRFVPQFLLQVHDQDSGGRQYRAYLDQYLPAALEPIRRRETPRRTLLSSVQMAQAPIPPSSDDEDNTVWGVATWDGVDPDTDFFSVFVQGLCNAYRWEDPDGAYQAGDPPGAGRRLVAKTLQLNFFRPGDQYLQHETEVRTGVAPGRASLYGDGVTEGLVYRWVYR